MIFIKGNVGSSKNGRQWTGKYSVASKTCQKYYKASEPCWKSEKNKQAFLKMLKGKSAPYYIEFTFVRGTKHKFDYINPCQTVQDLMVKYKWLPDDNADEIIPVFAPYIYDKTNPGVYITVL